MAENRFAFLDKDEREIFMDNVGNENPIEDHLSLHKLRQPVTMGRFAPGQWRSGKTVENKSQSSGEIRGHSAEDSGLRAAIDAIPRLRQKADAVLSNGIPAHLVA